MPKFLTLMNPHRRRRRRRLYGAAAAAHARRVGRRSRRRRNPMVFANPPRRRRRRRVRVIYARRRRRTRRNPPKMTPAMRAKISRAVRASFRRRRSSVPARRTTFISARRSSRRRGGFRLGGGGIVSTFKGALSKPMLMQAGGAVIASLGTGLIMQRWGAQLPMSNSKWGRVAYSVGIPIAGAALVRKYNRDVAHGMILGALVMGINALIQQARAATTVADYPMVEDMGVAGELGAYGFYPGGVGQIGVPATGAFPTSAY